MSLLTRIQRIVSELRRRRVFRAAAVYLAAAFVVLQVADIVVEPLGLPAWTLALIIVMLGAGLLLTLSLAWTFDVGADGLRRTAPAHDAGAAAGSDAPAPHGSERRRLAATAVAVLLLLGSGWYARTALSTSALFDPQVRAIAVLPFRTAGAGPELSYMREGLVDLLSAMLTDRAELPVVPPRVLLRELGDREAGDDRRTHELVRRVGATRMITGEVVGRADHLTLTATLNDLRSGRTVQATASGPERELDRLVERLAAQLVARDNPLTTDRLASLEGVPLAALRLYLEALALQRRGRFAESMEPLRNAVAIDSTFALAALAFDIAAGWATADPAESRRMQALAWEHRERLNPMDRLHVEAQIWTYPDITAPAVRLRNFEQALAVMPERHELWYMYGDLLMHEGQAVGVFDWPERAHGAFHRALMAVPDHVEVHYHLAEIAFMAADTAAFEASARVLESVADGVSMTGVVKGLRAMLLGDSANWRALRSLPQDIQGNAVYNLMGRALDDGRGIDSLLAIARDLERAAVTPAQAAAPAGAQYWLLANTGRPGAALEVHQRQSRRSGPHQRIQHLQATAWMGVAWDGDTAASRVAVEELRELLEQQAQRPAEAPPELPFFICTVAVIDFLHGRTDWAAQTGPWLERAAEEMTELWSRAQARACPVIIAAVTAHAAGNRTTATARLADLETHLTEKPFGAKRLRVIANLTAATLHEHYGNHEAALGAWRRLQDTEHMLFLTTALREEARLLDLLGRSDEATSVYTRYLVLRASAEPALHARDEPIRRRVASARPG